MIRRTVLAFALAGAAVIDVAAQTPRMDVTPSDARPVTRGAADRFTGVVLVEPLFRAADGTRASGAQVSFAAGARSAWHTHPAGQILIVTAGVGWVQEWDQPKREITVGDVVWTPPGVRHWHGASSSSSMTHIAVQETADGRVVTWLEPVTDAQYEQTAPPSPSRQEPRMNTHQDLRSVSPALERYAQTTLDGLWKRPELSPRDRSLVTVAALVARQQTAEMAFHIDLALDNGVKAAEISEVIAHLAFYSGWGNAMAAVTIAKDVFARRGVNADQLPAASPSLLPLDEAAEARRTASVEQQLGATAPGLVQYTTDPLFRDLWLRPGLAPRDRSLVTVSALIAAGHTAQMSYHLNRAMDHGLTQAQAGEVISHLAFYAGWPNAFSAATTAKDVFAARSRQARH